MKKDNRILKNLLFGSLGQLLTMALALFVPRLMIVSYGSDANGLVSAVNQAFSYLALLEAGIGLASVNRLYKDISRNDTDGVSYTLSATRRYFHRIIPVYAVCVAAFAVLFPFFAKTEVPHATIRLIIALQGVSSLVGFAFTNTLLQLLTADGRHYVQSNVSLLTKVIISGGQILLINNGFSIIATQSVILFANIVKAIVINVYARRAYPHLKNIKDADPKILDQRNAFLVHEFALVIFSCTDMFIISIFCSAAEASVYAVFQLVYTSIMSLVNIFSNSISFKQGHLYNAAPKKYPAFHDTFEAAYSGIVFACMSVTLYLAVPFVGLYTAGVSDAFYTDPKLPVLFALIQILSCSRATCSKVISIAGHAKRTIPQTLLESGLNLGLSLILVQTIGIYGVLLGTIFALAYRVNDILCYANLKILKRKPVHTYLVHGVYFLIFGLNYLLSRHINLNITGYGQFFLWGIALAAIMVAIYGIAMILLDRKLRCYGIHALRSLWTRIFSK